MAKVILGKKLGMTQIFTEEGKVVPVTVVESGKNVVLQSKTVETDGYNAVQIGFGTVKEKNVTKPMKGHFAKAGVEPVKFIRELRLADVPEYKAGDSISVDIFGAGDLVDVTGTSKGKGFAGGIKRHNFARGPMGHGSKSHREPGSTGAMISGHGGRVLKGKKLPGRMEPDGALHFRGDGEIADIALRPLLVGAQQGGVARFQQMLRHGPLVSGSQEGPLQMDAQQLRPLGI